MSITERILTFDSTAWIGLFAAIVVLAHLVPYFLDPYGIRSYPGPLIARLSDCWLGWAAAQGHRSERVHELHQKYGKIVRIAPNHVSIADTEALQVVYGHGVGTLKSDFYDAFISIEPALFTTRSRTQHARKRKLVAHIFSQQSVLEFEPRMRSYLAQLIQQWDKLCDGGEKGLSGDEGHGWRGNGGRVWFDCSPWYNYLTFDITGDLAFGASFGMLTACRDSAPVAVSREAAMAAYGKSNTKEMDIEYFPAIQVLNDRGNYSASMGVLPPHWRPLANKIPWFSKGHTAVKRLAGIAIAAVAQRLASENGAVDFLAKLMDGRDSSGDPMGLVEVTAEVLGQLIAGSDTTSNSSCAIMYHLARNPHIQHKLQKELDQALGDEDEPIALFEQVKRLTYLEAVINEAIRVHAPAGIGLPRIVPEGGITVCGEFFPEGTILSVPTYTIQRDKELWGMDADEFRPERWFEVDKITAQKGFNPFSFGPRSCVGRNLANLEILVTIASLFRRYDFVLQNPSEELDTSEGFLRKPVSCMVGMKRRNVQV